MPKNIILKDSSTSVLLCIDEVPKIKIENKMLATSSSQFECEQSSGLVLKRPRIKFLPSKQL